MARKRLRLSDIETAPPYNLTVEIISSRNVRMLGDVLKSGKGYPAPIIGHCGEKYYPVSNLDMLEAARAAGMEEIDCIVEDADNINTVAKMHISHSRHITYNPISLISMIKKIEESGGDMSGIPPEVQKISRLRLDDNVMVAFDKFITDLAKRNIEVPSLLHILQPLSKIENGKQGRVLSEIINYTIDGGNHLPPNNDVLRSIIARHTDGGDLKNTSGKMIRIEPKPEYVDDRDDIRYEDVEASMKKSRDVGIEISSNRDAAEYTCTSCVEKIRELAKATKKRTVHVADIVGCTSKYLIDFKNSKIKELRDGDKHITAIETLPEPIYSLSGTDAKFLELDMGSIIYSHRIGGRNTGEAVLWTKRKLEKDKIDAILAIINGKQNPADMNG